MKKVLKRAGGAILLGLTWAVVWAPTAVVAGLIIDPDGSMDEMWAAIGAYPAILCGALFFALAGVAESRRRLDELSVQRASALGVVAGLIVGIFPFTVGTSTTKLPLWQLAAIVIGSFTLFAALSAAVSVMVARTVRRRGLRADATRLA